MYEKIAAADAQNLGTAIRAIIARARLAKTHSKIGSLASARDECRKAVDLLQATVDNAANASQRRLRVLAYEDLGDTYAVLGADTWTLSSSAGEHWRAARDMYQRSLNIMQDLLNHGILDAEEIPEIQSVSRKIAECDTFLGR
jgi:hypothetical protein